MQASESMSIDESDAPAADRDEQSSKPPIAADEWAPSQVLAPRSLAVPELYPLPPLDWCIAIGWQRCWCLPCLQVGQGPSRKEVSSLRTEGVADRALGTTASAVA